MITRSLMPLSRLLADPSVKRTPADAEEAIAVLEERAAGIEHIEQVRFAPFLPPSLSHYMNRKSLLSVFNFFKNTPACID